jgi:hypothetical protein
MICLATRCKAAIADVSLREPRWLVGLERIEWYLAERLLWLQAERLWQGSPEYRYLSNNHEVR